MVKPLNPANRWHSWDRHPWLHPWLTAEHLQAMKSYSRAIWLQARTAVENSSAKDFRYGFVGNIANNLYMRAVPLRRSGLNITLFLHPHDKFVMSHPSWEEFDGELPGGPADVPTLLQAGVPLPFVSGVEQQDQLRASLTGGARAYPEYIRRGDLRWQDYLSFLPTLEALQPMDALLTVQTPYLAYLAHRPYLATQCGGDIWYECSRDDLLGHLQRTAFSAANAFLVSNPWSFSHARRYGMTRMVYLPLILDEHQYSPGEPRYRTEWEQKTGGSFFVLSTARLDNAVKGSKIGLEAFARFSSRHPEARLVVLGWGADAAASTAWLEENALSGKVLVLPLAGKARLISYLRSADVLLDQFVLGYFGSTALEAMACGLPVIMRLERAQYDALCETGAPPVYDASTVEEVEGRLEVLRNNPDELADAKLAHRRWLVANHGSDRWAPVYADMLAATALGYRFSFRGSPLARPLSPRETAYHEMELAHAPQFPNYV